MNRIVEWVKAHPYLAGSLVLGLVILWFIRRNAAAQTAAAAQATASTVAGPSDALQEAELSAATSAQTAQLQAQQNIALANASLNGQAIQYGYQTTLAQLASQDALAQAAMQQDTTDNQTAAALAASLAQSGQTPIFRGTIGGLTFSGVNPAQPAVPAPAPVPAPVPAAVPAAVQNYSTIAPATNAPAADTSPTAPATPATVAASYAPVAAPLVPVAPASQPMLVASAASATYTAAAPVSTYVPATSPAPAIYAPATGGGYVIPQVAQGAPVATGSNYEATYDVIPGSVQDPYNQYGVAQQTANVNAAETAYVNDPNSCHNSVAADCIPLY